MIQQLIYVSRAAAGLTPQDAFDIVRVAHNRNSQNGLTGALLLLDGHFLQVLEGDPWQLSSRFDIIKRDPRHTHLQVRRRSTVVQPTFPQDWMALRHGDAIGPELRQRFGYRPGFPEDALSPAQLLAFAQACCAQATAEV